MKKQLEKTAHIIFVSFLYILSFLKLRAVKTLSEQFPEFQSFQFPAQKQPILLLYMSFFLSIRNTLILKGQNKGLETIQQNYLAFSPKCVIIHQTL